MTYYDPTQTPTDANELVSWIADRLAADSQLESLLRGAGRVYEHRRPDTDDESLAIVRLRMPVGGRRQTFSGTDGPSVQTFFTTFADEPNPDTWHRAVQARTYALLTGQTPDLDTSRVVQKLRRTGRPNPPRWDDDHKEWYSLATYHAVLAPLS